MKMKHKPKPNLFRWGTSELTQDAFLCWLLEWADPEFKEYKLHQIATKLIFEFTDNDLKSITKIEIRKQYKNIDILVQINDDIGILIEDKVHSNEHSNQLSRYSEILQKEFKSENLFLVYLKTGDESNLKSIESKGYKAIMRKDLLRILEEGEAIGIVNNIYTDFLNYLRGIENSVNSYLSIHINDWHWDSWKGFYSDLQIRLKDGEWKYIPQRNGGFLGFNWFWNSISFENESYNYYLQLEHQKFCFKIAVWDNDKKRVMRDYFRSKLYPKAIEHKIPIRQNGRIGNNMTVAKLDEDFRITKPNGIIDMEKTVSKILKIENMMRDIK